jgi:hypothetical protein
MFRNAEIEIRKPAQGWLNTAIVIQDYKDYLSENSVSYWCNIPEYGIELKVAKDSPEGVQITRAIKDKKRPGQFKYILLEMALPRISPVQFVDIINGVRQEAKDEGRTEIRQGMLHLLFPNGV